MFQGMTVLVTGASSGIGKAFAYKFAKRSAHLVLVARNKDKLEAIKFDLKSNYHIDIHLIDLDLQLPGAATKLLRTTQALSLNIDILINNAGFGKWGRFEAFDIKTYENMIQLNITTLTELCHLYLPYMKSKQQGGIINIASSAALLPVPYAAVYSATKSYVLNFSDALHGELAETGVTVSCLCPGGTDTNFAKVANEKVTLNQAILESAESVAESGIEAFIRKQNYTLLGKNKRLIQLVSRLLPRKNMLKVAGNAFKKIIEAHIS